MERLLRCTESTTRDVIMVVKLDNITKVPSIESTGTRVRYNEAAVATLVGRYLEELHVVPRTPQSGSELDDFFGLLQNAVTSKQAYEGVPEADRILVVEEDPPETVDTEAITFFLDSRIPGSFAQGPAGQGKIKEVVPHLRAITDHPEAPSQKLVTMGRFYENWITFNIYARTNKIARQRLLWFERTMDIYNWYFRLYGFRVVEQSTGKRERKSIDELKLTKYPITYIVRTDDTFHFSSQELIDVILKVELSNY